MPDLNEIPFWCCESVIRDTQWVQSSQGLIPVYWERAPHYTDYSMWWRCGHSTRGCWPWVKNRECKHTERAREQWCGWDTGPGFGHEGAPIEAQTEYGDHQLLCPRCGRQATTQRWAV